MACHPLKRGDFFTGELWYKIYRGDTQRALHARARSLGAPLRA
nr:MAG TPA: hypothetical protein [Caudoviricetes sp.]